MTARPPYPPGTPSSPELPSEPKRDTQRLRNATPGTPDPQIPPQAPVPQNISATGPIGSSAASSTGPVGKPGVITVKYPQVGTILRSPRGEYEVRKVLGSGQFGAVYDCVGPFDQGYAVKVIRPANRPLREVFEEWQRETTRLQSLRHPNVVYLFDAFEQEHLFYQALERCDHALTSMLGRAMQEGLVIEMGRQLLAAVQFLHDNDIIHDDLHPGNVLVTEGADRPVLKISDFGISADLRGAAAIRPNVVHHKIMAPEILASGYTTKQSDLYQVGLLMYWMLMGQPAIPQDAPYQELVRIVGEGIPRKRAEDIGTPLGNVIARMLRRRETFRYTSAKEVWSELRLLPSWQGRELFPTK